MFASFASKGVNKGDSVVVWTTLYSAYFNEVSTVYVIVTARWRKMGWSGCIHETAERASHLFI
jgi:hypothetical protein